MSAPNRTFEAAAQTLAKSFDAAVQGAAAQRLIIIDFAQKNLNLGFDLAKSLAGASSLSEIVELQAVYWRKQFDAFTTQAEEVRAAAKPKAVETWPEAIQHEPAKETPPPAQEAPKKGHRPPARDPAGERQRRDTPELDAPPAAGRPFRPPAETQLGTRKKGGAGDEAKRKQSPTRISVAEGRTQKSKARASSGQSAPPGVRPPDERQSGSPKRVLRKTRLFSKYFRPR